MLRFPVLWQHSQRKVSARVDVAHTRGKLAFLCRGSLEASMASKGQNVPSSAVTFVAHGLVPAAALVRSLPVVHGRGSAEFSADMARVRECSLRNREVTQHALSARERRNTGVHVPRKPRRKSSQYRHGVYMQIYTSAPRPRQPLGRNAVESNIVHTWKHNFIRHLTVLPACVPAWCLSRYFSRPRPGGGTDYTLVVLRTTALSPTTSARA
jgi:hypothetical protein